MRDSNEPSGLARGRGTRRQLVIGKYGFSDLFTLLTVDVSECPENDNKNRIVEMQPPPNFHAAAPASIPLSGPSIYILRG